MRITLNNIVKFERVTAPIAAWPVTNAAPSTGGIFL